MEVVGQPDPAAWHTTSTTSLAIIYSNLDLLDEALGDN
jgi:hypothetical protein